MNRFTVIVLTLIFIAALGWIGKTDYQDELDEEQRYIEFVCDGTWPDYRNLEPECK